MGGPYHPAVVRTVTDEVTDDGGSIVTPGEVTTRDCLCQVDAATEAMRSDASFTIGDVRLLVLNLDALSTDARVEVTAGPGAGLYSLQTVFRDPMGAYWECRGRPA